MMKMLMITAMHSGAGKTVMSCAVMAALKNRGIRVQPFKCGPDYIDPMFHERVTGVPGRNLDLFLQGEAGVRRTLKRAERQTGAGYGLAEAAMGYYDGINGTDRASAWDTARRLGLPAVLVLRPEGGGVSLAAQVKGMLSFRPENGIRGLLLSGCSAGLAAYLKPILERETGLPLLGFLPSMPEAEVESRHLGLLTAGEIRDLPARLSRLAAAAEEHIDMEMLLSLFEEPRRVCCEEREESFGPAPARCRIAVAKDEAFCFIYADTLDALREAGAELCFFSPLHDRRLPESADGLYLPGGYPELYAGALSRNGEMRRSVAEAIQRGMPAVAECGGFLYLQESLEDTERKVFPMCGVLAGKAFKTGKLQRFGYLKLTEDADSLLFCSGEEIPAHEFHYWDTTVPGAALRAEKENGRAWRCAVTGKSLYAGFPHLHFDGKAPLAARFERACEEWRREKNS